MSVQREKVRFVSGDAECAAWFYPGSNGACVIMAGGFAVTKEPATDKFARRFSDAGYAVLAFDYRRLGESGGQPRLVQPVGDMLADWQRSISHGPCQASTRTGSRSGASPRVAATSSGLQRAIRSSLPRSRRHRTLTGSPRARMLPVTRSC